MKTLFLLVTTILITACSSNPRKPLYTMDDKSRPTWADSSTPRFEKGKNFNYVGVYETTKTKNTNMNAVKKASELKAWEEISKHVSTQVSQLAGLKTNSDSETNDMSASEELKDNVQQATKSMFNKAHVSGRWYIVYKADENGETVKTVEYFTVIQIHKNDFMKAVKKVTEAKK